MRLMVLIKQTEGFWVQKYQELGLGWLLKDIYVVENTGTMLSNANGVLNESNLFCLDHH